MLCPEAFLTDKLCFAALKFNDIQRCHGNELTHGNHDVTVLGVSAALWRPRQTPPWLQFIGLNLLYYL